GRNGLHSPERPGSWEPSALQGVLAERPRHSGGEDRPVRADRILPSEDWRRQRNHSDRTEIDSVLSLTLRAAAPEPPCIIGTDGSAPGFSTNKGRLGPRQQAPDAAKARWPEVIL